ncbi:MAG: hypothetical protein P4M11_13105 [Candidatus Pacebacteria bacterium]|nr:hypothetical protein [Candidatus Paceibacterota bacterium]
MLSAGGLAKTGGELRGMVRDGYFEEFADGDGAGRGRSGRTFTLVEVREEFPLLGGAFNGVHLNLKD